MKVTNAQAEKIRESVEDPCAFAKGWLGSTMWEKQADILRSIDIPHSRTAVKACHSSGKTYSAALASLWWLARWQEGIVVTTAPTWGQVERLLWGEIHSTLSKARFPFPKPTKTELKLGPKRYAVGLSTNVTNQDEGVRFQGFHAEHVLMVFDEAPGVDPKIWQAAEGIRAGGDVRFLCQGNPTFSGGPFYDTFQGKGGWNTFTISAFDTPNFQGVYLKYRDADGNDIVQGDSTGRDLMSMGKADLDDNALPYLITRRWVYEKFNEWGPGSYLFESRVLGGFPSQSEDALIGTYWIQKAGESEVEAMGKIHAGIDVAGPGEAETVLVLRRGPRVISMKSWAASDPRGEILAALMPVRDQLASVNVDSAGIGWGIYLHLRDELKALHVSDSIIHPVNVGESPNDGDKYANLKAELYWQLRGRFLAGEISGITDEMLTSQLGSIRYQHTPQGKIQIESKSDAQKRGVSSPDRAEALMLAYAESNQYIFGALDFSRQEEAAAKTGDFMKKVKVSGLIKPAMSDKSLSCPNCGGKAIVRIAGEDRCNNCGHSWNRQFEIAQSGSRGDVLAKVKR